MTAPDRSDDFDRGVANRRAVLGDEWVDRSLAKIGTDVALLAQGEVGEVAEPAGEGRGGSSAMPQKRNPVAALAAIAAGVRAPQHAATLLAAMRQAHERGLGDWQAELAEWPPLFLSVHGALVALADAVVGLEVDVARDRAFAGVGADAIAAAFDVDAAARRAGNVAIARLDRLLAAPSTSGDPR